MANDYRFKIVKMHGTILAILITIKSKHLINIVNGIKKFEIRKNKALKQVIEELIKEYGYATIYVGCSQEKPYLNCLDDFGFKWFWLEDKDILGVTENSKKATGGLTNGFYRRLNRQIIGKFECHKIEDFYFVEDDRNGNYSEVYLETEIENLEEKSCLSFDDLLQYVGLHTRGYAIHISNFEIFKYPKKVEEFRPYGWSFHCALTNCNLLDHSKEECAKCGATHIHNLPQNFTYLEIK